ncbi:hypothetical protein N8500_05410 [Candidatus Puniceispirillum sp.]|nr:hypothetical protein [Candidatus Puniceispirillum sp.]
MNAADAYPDYVDCNTISPDTSKKIVIDFDGLLTNFVDAGIIGLNPLKETGHTRLYVSDGDTALL